MSSFLKTISPPVLSALSRRCAAVPPKPARRLGIGCKECIFSTATSVNIATPMPVATADSAKLIFKKVWSKLELEGLNLELPKDILWLIGAPGSGKGTVTPYIQKAQKSLNAPICMSSLLQSPKMKESIAAGRLVDDEMVLEQLLRTLATRDPLAPLIIDGFPRTTGQVAMIHALHKQLHHPDTFKVAVLYISQRTSLARQLKRGIEARLHNAKVRASGRGHFIEERATDFSKELVEARYHAFESQVGAMVGLARHFPFHMVNADCGLDDVVSHLLHLFDTRYPHPPTASPQCQNVHHSSPSSPPPHHHHQQPLEQLIPTNPQLHGFASAPNLAP